MGHFLRLTLCFASFSCVLAAVGCSSISGKRVTYAADGGVTVTDVGGLPILVTRPTRAVFIVTINTYGVTQLTERDGELGEPVTLPDQTEMKISEQPIMLGPTDIYTIDPKRPAFGTLDYGIEMTNGVVTKVTGKLDDKTLGEVRQMLNDILAKVLPGPGDVVPESGVTTTRTLKSQRIRLAVFDLATGRLEMSDL